VPLVLGDLRRQLGQLRDLMPGGLGVLRPSLGRQGLVAAVAVAGDERDDLVQAFGRQAPPQPGGVSRLSAGLLAGALLGDGLGGAGRVGRGRGAGVGGVGAKARFEFGDAAFQRRDAFVALQPAAAGVESTGCVSRKTQILPRDRSPAALLDSCLA
jgi:hypothetical protein